MSLSREKVNALSQILAKGLAELPGVTFCAPENTVRLEIVRAIQDALKLEDAIDEAAVLDPMKIEALSRCPVTAH